MKKRDLFATGKRIHQEWKGGDAFYRKLLGDFDPAMSRFVIDLRLSNDALSDDQRQEFWLGWESASA